MSPSHSLPQPRLYNPSTDSPLLPQLARIQAACILSDGQLATFLPPFDMSAMTTYWQHSARNAGVIPTLERPSGCEIVLQMAPREEGEVVAGYVVLSMAWSQTGPFRGEVLKLMVSPERRRRRVARRLMGMLEDVATEKGRTMLVSFLKTLRWGLTFRFLLFFRTDQHRGSTPKSARTRRKCILSLGGRSWVLCRSTALVL